MVTQSADALHPTTTFDHSGLVTVGLTACASCHDDTLISASTETHNACASCHDATTGALTGSAVGNPAPSDCTTCHGGAFDTLHAGHIHTVLENATDLSYDPPGQLCSVCHVVSTWTEINDTEHNVATNGAGPCATCHSSTRQEVIDAITLGADPTICLDCHSNKLLTVHGNEDHSALGYVTFGATSCQTCHDPGVSADGTVTVIHLGTCAHCHTSAPTLQAGIPAGGGDCAVCHTGSWGAEHTPAIDHTALVTVGVTTCANCHTDTLVSAAPETHNACTSCHDAGSGALYPYERLGLPEDEGLLTDPALQNTYRYVETMLAGDPVTGMQTFGDTQPFLTGMAVGADLGDGGIHSGGGFLFAQLPRKEFLDHLDLLAFPIC